MSIEAEMTKDIKSYEPKIIGPFTSRQIISIGLGVLTAAPISLILPVKDPMIKLTVFCILMAPFLMCGWVKIYGIYLEKFVIQTYRLHVINPRKRKYKVEGSRNYLLSDIKSGTGSTQTKDKKKITRSKNIEKYK